MKTTALTVVRPVAITPAMIVSTNIPEDDYPEWDAEETYTLTERVMLSSTHKVYQSAKADNVGKDPATEPTAWKEVGSTNRYRLFDRSISSQTAQASTISYRLRPGQAVTALGAMNLTGATSMRVRVVDPTYGTVYDKTLNLSSVPVATGWWQWFFGQRRVPTQALLMDLPSFPVADVLVDFTGSVELAVGVLLVGQSRQFSMGIRMGARVGIQDYSRKEKTEFGDTVLVERAYARRASFSMLLRASEVDELNNFLAEVRATPCLWIGSSRYESLTVYGFFKSFEIVIAYFDYSDTEIELEGLT